MKCVLEINDGDLSFPIKQDANYRARTAARAVLRNKDKIALLHVTRHNYYKLPGGGVDEGETIRQALVREVAEETGCTLKARDELGEILEHRSQQEIVQTSHCYLADVETVGKPEFTEKEIGDGFELVWVSFDEAIKLLKESQPDNYSGKFIVMRDLKFLEEARRFFSKTI